MNRTLELISELIELEESTIACYSDYVDYTRSPDGWVEVADYSSHQYGKAVNRQAVLFAELKGN